jgi:hypothetical protein
MRTIRIDVTKIDKSAIYEGKSGKYIDLVMFDNREGADQYGNLGFVTQDLGKDRRLAGERGAILGNWKEIGERREAAATVDSGAPAGHATDGVDDIPF